VCVIEGHSSSKKEMKQTKNKEEDKIKRRKEPQHLFGWVPVA